MFYSTTTPTLFYRKNWMKNLGIPIIIPFLYMKKKENALKGLPNMGTTIIYPHSVGNRVFIAQLKIIIKDPWELCAPCPCNSEGFKLLSIEGDNFIRGKHTSLQAMTSSVGIWARKIISWQELDHQEETELLLQNGELEEIPMGPTWPSLGPCGTLCQAKCKQTDIAMQVWEEHGDQGIGWLREQQSR